MGFEPLVANVLCQGGSRYQERTGLQQVHCLIVSFCPCVAGAIPGLLSPRHQEIQLLPQLR